MVAFANSVPDGKYAVIFIGVADDGAILGVLNSDDRQKKIRKVAEQECYPSVDVQMIVVSEQDLDVIAVIVPASKRKPHFAGPAYIRIGSECINASEIQYEELINSRNSVCREILKNKDAVFTVRTINKKLGVHNSDNRPYAASHECKIVECLRLSYEKILLLKAVIFRDDYPNKRMPSRGRNQADVVNKTNFHRRLRTKFRF